MKKRNPKKAGCPSWILEGIRKVREEATKPKHKEPHEPPTMPPVQGIPAKMP